MDVIVPYHQVIELNLIARGDYRVIDGVSLKALGELTIAAPKAGGPGSDDRPYAPIQDVNLNWGDNGPKLTLTLEDTPQCVEFKDIEVRYQQKDNIIIVLPVVDKMVFTGDPCKTQEDVALKDLKEGATYLVHVRSMNGQAVNKLQTLLPKPR